MPDAVQELLPGLATDAQRAIQFTRSTPGIAVALVGMGRREHVLENLGVAHGAAGHARTVSAPVPVMTAIEVADDLAQLDAAIEALPESARGLPAVADRGRAVSYRRPALLRRRLLRLLNEREKPSRLLNLRHTVARIEYRLTGSAFESRVVLLRAGAAASSRTRYLELMKLRMPPYVKIVLNNEFPRSQITTHLTRDAAGLYFGPFRSRASAERFEAQFLDLFQMRRCQEDLVPSPEHPGCIYGEMAMCLRPCQQVVGPAEYAHEVARVVRVPAHRTGARCWNRSATRATA